MGKLGKAIEESEEVSDKDRQAANDGQRMMIDAAKSSKDALMDPDMGGDGIKRVSNIQQELSDLQETKNIADKFIDKGGVSGTKKDNYDLTFAYNEWIKSRNTFYSCPEKLSNESVRYITLTKNGASENKIQKVYNSKEEIKKECEKAPTVLMDNAIKYLEIDRRVRENKLADSNKMPIIEGFQYKPKSITLASNEDVNTVNTFSHIEPSSDVIISDNKSQKEGFEWYRDRPKISAVTVSNPRIPLYSEQNIKTGDGTGLLSWNEFYTDCTLQTDQTARTQCESAMKKKEIYIKAINNLFFEADTLINVLYQLNASSSSGSNSGIDDNITDRVRILKKVLERQSSDIDLFKQKALYSYDQHNTLATIEDAAIFVYYALVVIYVILFARDWFMSKISTDIRQIAVVLMMVFYPQVILKIALWVLTALNKFVDLLGIKNVEFW
jgi:hypothetical protein